MSDGFHTFSAWAEAYRQLGFWPRPVKPGSKSPLIPAWNKPDDQFPDSERERWLPDFGNCGIGLVMGSPFSDGTTLGALDVDHDDYVRVARALLGDPRCGRIGKKGAVFFVRVRGEPKYSEFKVKGDAGRHYGKVAECLFGRRFCIIPPTTHPVTNQPYRWIGKSLLETSFDELPIVEI